MQPEKGQVYLSRRSGIRVKILNAHPSGSHVRVTSLGVGFVRWVHKRHFHVGLINAYGKPRRCGYVLEEEDEQPPRDLG